MSIEIDEVLCPMCGYSDDIVPKDGVEADPSYYCLACDHEFLLSESGKLLVQRPYSGQGLIRGIRYR